MASIPTHEPVRFARGDSVSWTRRLVDYPPSDGWTLHYAAVQSGQAAIVIDGSDNGDGSYLVEIGPVTSARFALGYWRWQVYVTLGNPVTKRHTVLWGSLIVDPDYATQTTGYDGRSRIKMDLDAVEAALAVKITGGDVSSYAISSGSGSRSLTRYSYDELLRLRDRLRAEYNREQRREARARGESSRSVTLVRFVR